MALDSQQNRMSAMGHGRPFMRAVFPVDTPTQAWRLNVGLAYAGNAIAAAAAILEFCGPLFTGLLDPARLSGFLDPLRKSDLLDPARLSDQGCP